MNTEQIVQEEVENFVINTEYVLLADPLRHAIRQAIKEAEKQEPVAWLVTYGGLKHVAYTQPTQVVDTHYQPLYTSTKHIWVGLTDEEITEIRLKSFDSIATNRQVYEAIEAKLREKNGG